MALKEQVSNVYGAGLRNVGSYQVSGAPHITTKTISDLAETSITFPQVTKDITINKTSAGGETRVHFLTKGTQKKALEFRDTTPPDGTTDDLFSIPINTGEQETFTFSFWFKINSPVTGQISLWQSPGGGHGATQSTKIVSLNASQPTAAVTFRNQVKDRVIGAGTSRLDTVATNFSQLEYNNYVVSIAATEYKVYINGQDHGAGALSLPNGVSEMPNLHFPRNFTSPISLAQFTLWDKALSSAEVLELYHSGHYLNPQLHSAASNLDHWFVFDNTLSSNPDTTSQIFDRVGTLTGSITTQAGQTNSVAFVDGPGNFQTGSTVITNMHYLSLDDANPSVTLNCKCNKIFLTATGSAQTVNVIANMTHIASGSMYALTGSGIDE